MDDTIKILKESLKNNKRQNLTQWKLIYNEYKDIRILQLMYNKKIGLKDPFIYNELIKNTNNISVKKYLLERAIRNCTQNKEEFINSLDIIENSSELIIDMKSVVEFLYPKSIYLWDIEWIKSKILSFNLNDFFINNEMVSFEYKKYFEFISNKNNIEYINNINDSVNNKNNIKCANNTNDSNQDITKHNIICIIKNNHINNIININKNFNPNQIKINTFIIYNDIYYVKNIENGEYYIIKIMNAQLNISKPEEYIFRRYCWKNDDNFAFKNDKLFYQPELTIKEWAFYKKYTKLTTFLKNIIEPYIYYLIFKKIKIFLTQTKNLKINTNLEYFVVLFNENDIEIRNLGFYGTNNYKNTIEIFKTNLKNFEYIYYKSDNIMEYQKFNINYNDYLEHD